MRFSPPGLPCDGCDNLSPCTNNYCRTFTDEWEAVTLISGIYDKPPPYYENYAPCCYRIALSGVTQGSGFCPNCDSMNGIGTVTGRFALESGSLYYYIDIYGYSPFSCNSANILHLGYGLHSFGPYDSNTKYDCRNMSFDVNNWFFGDYPGMCDFSNIGATVTAVYSPELCRDGLEYYIGNIFEPCIGASGYPLNIPISGACIFESGNYICYQYNQCGDYQCVPASGFYSQSLGITVANFTLTGVTGLDDAVPESGVGLYTCKKCNSLNRTWLHGTEFDTCCDCPEQMCLTDWDIYLTYPSSYIMLKSTHGDVAKWTSSTPSGVCPSSPLTFVYNSGSSAIWNRCDFSSSSIELNFDTEINNYYGSQRPCGNNLNQQGITSRTTLFNRFPLQVGSSFTHFEFVVEIPDDLVDQCAGTCTCQIRPITGAVSVQIQPNAGTDYSRGFSDCPGNCFQNISPCSSGFYPCATDLPQDRWYYIQYPFSNITGCQDFIDFCGEGSPGCPNNVVDADGDTCTDTWYQIHYCPGCRYTERITLYFMDETSSTMSINVSQIITTVCTNFGGIPYTWSSYWQVLVNPSLVTPDSCGSQDKYYTIPTGVYTLNHTSSSSSNSYIPYTRSGSSITLEIL